jgi:hypothetical protein
VFDHPVLTSTFPRICGTASDRRPFLATRRGNLLAQIVSDLVPPDTSDLDESGLSQLVLGYLEEHPHAMETLDGIAEWWIERRMIRVDVEALSSALEDLTARGVLEGIGTGPARRYRLKAPRNDAD